MMMEEDNENNDELDAIVSLLARLDCEESQADIEAFLDQEAAALASAAPEAAAAASTEEGEEPAAKVRVPSLRREL
jgi:hypothetical protein